MFFSLLFVMVSAFLFSVAVSPEYLQPEQTLAELLSTLDALR